MNEELDFIIKLAKEKMEESLSHLDKSMINIRAGKANPNMLNSIKIDYYGTLTPLSQVSNINISDARTLTINPWEKNMLQEIEKAIQIADLGFNPMNNGESIIINIPAPKSDSSNDLKALIFDSKYDSYKGAIAYVKIVSGEITKGQKYIFIAPNPIKKRWI